MKLYSIRKKIIEEMDDNVNKKNETIHTANMTTLQEVPTRLGNAAKPD